jgi:hypothetical protein
VRRLAFSLYVLLVFMAMPAVALAAGTTPSSSSGNDAPTGHDYTIDTIFVVALGIPAMLALLSLIDVARGKHTERHTEH